MRRLHLVRHGLPAFVEGRPPHAWGLDPAGFDAIDALGSSGRLPEHAVWFSSPEAKALGTARRLTAGEITVVDDLREQERGPTAWFDDLDEWRGVLRRVFTQPDVPAMPGWEPLSRTSDRVVAAVRRVLTDHTGDVVLVGHGTAWTALKAALTGSAPDLDAWERLQMPDVWVIETP